jgi:hypothetical protein
VNSRINRSVADLISWVACFTVCRHTTWIVVYTEETSSTVKYFEIFGGQWNFFLSQIDIDTNILHKVILLGSCKVVWTYSGQETCSFWSCRIVVNV